MNMHDEIGKLDATAQAELVRKGEVSPGELVDAAIARIERDNPPLNAVITPLFDKARATAAGHLPDGPFRGVPMLVKDLQATTAGDPYYAGTRFLRDRKYVAPHDSYLIEKFRAAGFVIAGKTNTPEFGILPTTEPLAFGPTRNPHAPDHSTGGSSGGSAAAVAARMVAVAHANDGGGSIRIPASCCGLVGLKPSRGRTSLGPDTGDINGGLVNEGVVTRTVRDTAAVLDAIAGSMPGDPYGAPPLARPLAAEVGAAPGRLRIGFSAMFPGMGGAPTRAHADCGAAVELAARRLADLGHQVDEGAPTALTEPDYIPKFMTLWAAGVAFDVDSWSETIRHRLGADDVEPLTWALAEMGRKTHGGQYLQALAWLRGNARRVISWWTDHDLLLTPTMAEPPPLLGELASTPDKPMALQPIMRSATLVPFTPPFNVTGQPAISLPLHKTAAGLPIGIQLVAAYGREDLLVRVAAQLEAAHGWA